MAEAVSQDRLQTAREVVARLREDPAFGGSIVANEAGERPILVASIDDSMRELLKRIGSIGLPVTLCVRGGSASMTVATVRAIEPHDHPAESEAIHPKATVGMFISYVWVKGSVAFHLEEPAPAEPGAVEYELEFA
jgi:hypothetical protein